MITRRAVAYGALLAAILALAAFLRFDDLGGPSFWLDEILGQLHVEEARATVRWWQWLTGFHPEHGPLYYATELWIRDEWTARFPPALFGVVSVVLVWFAARRASGSELAAVSAAVLLAISPLHVYYSREARPYGLIFLLTSAMLVAVLRRSWRIAGVVLVLLLYTSTATASVVATAAIAAAIVSLLSRDDGKRGARTIALLAVATLPFFLLLYKAGGAAEPPVRFPGVGVSFFDRVVRGLSVTVLDSTQGGNTAYLLLLLALVGAVVLIRRHRAEGFAVVTFTLLPLVFALSALWSVDHWYAVRYISPSVIGFMILAGSGAAATARLIARVVPARRPRAQVALASLLTAAILGGIAIEVWPMAYREPRRKFDWRELTRTLWNTAEPGDLLIAAEGWSEQALRYYARDLPKRVTIVRAVSRENAEELVARFPASWLVTGGFAADPSVRNWMCSHPQLFASAIDGVRVHYAPSASHFLQHRATEPDHRATAAAAGTNPFMVRLGLRDSGFLGDGWGTPEGEDESLTFRWVTGTRATVGVPRLEGASQLRIIAMPLDDPSLPPQTVTPIVGGHRLVTTTMRPGWSEYWFDVPEAAWAAGWNELAFEFGRAGQPSKIYPDSRDDRVLAAALYSVTIGRHALAEPKLVPRARTLEPRLASAAMLQDAFWDDQSAERFPPARLRRETIEPLLGRLGFDPQTTWPRVASGAMRIEDIVETAAYGTDCVGDDYFFSRAGELILDRPLAPGEIEGLKREMKKHGYSRPRMAIYLARSDEFRAKVLK